MNEDASDEVEEDEIEDNTKEVVADVSALSIVYLPLI